VYHILKKEMRNLEKIVEVFQLHTSQATKDEEGHLKVQVVVDWSNSGGLKAAKEYSKFFQWAKYLNNYHPNIKAVSFQHLYYYPIATKLNFMTSR